MMHSVHNILKININIICVFMVFFLTFTALHSKKFGGFRTKKMIVCNIEKTGRANDSKEKSDLFSDQKFQVSIWKGFVQGIDFLK